ncbi:MAG: hypothetical protein ACO271_02110 [Burkholderiales bacterium]
MSLERAEHFACREAPDFKHAALVEMTNTGESTVLLTTDPKLDRIALLLAARLINAQDLAVVRRVLKVDCVTLEQQSLS